MRIMRFIKRKLINKTFKMLKQLRTSTILADLQLINAAFALIQTQIIFLPAPHLNSGATVLHWSIDDSTASCNENLSKPKLSLCLQTEAKAWRPAIALNRHTDALSTRPQQLSLARALSLSRSLSFTHCALFDWPSLFAAGVLLLLLLYCWQSACAASVKIAI